MSVDQIQDMTNVCGVYVLYNDRGRVMYVGQSLGVSTRLQFHRLRMPTIGLIKIARVWDRDERELLESRLLYRLRPRFNGVLPTIFPTMERQRARVRMSKVR